MPTSRKLGLVADTANREIAGRDRRNRCFAAAALKGDPSAAYEIGVRYAEGKGVTSNFRRSGENGMTGAAQARRDPGGIPARNPV